MSRPFNILFRPLSKGKAVFLLFLYLLFPSCIETFEIDLLLDTSAVVVTGLITDKSPATVELRRPVESQRRGPTSSGIISGAVVTLIDDEGRAEQLTEIRRGFYEGASPGEVGRSYSIEIILPDERIIVSEAQLLKPNPSIDSLYLEQSSFFRSFGSDVQVDFRGLNLNLYMNRTDTVSRYYRWIVGGTYQFYSAFDFNQEEDPCFYTLPPPPSFILGESTSPNADVFLKTLQFITPNSTYLYGHSVELAQYSQTKAAYDYWKLIDDQQRNVGSIFDPPPAQAVGNLRFVEEGDDIVMGFFEAASVKTRRVFIDRNSFGNLDPERNYFSDRGINGPCFPPAGWIGPWNPPAYCDDCTLLANSTDTQPPYWP